MDARQGLRTVDELASQGDALWERYAALKQHSPNSPECVALAAEVLAWLRGDVQQHGVYVPSGSQERRALRAMLDDAVSRLVRDGHPGIVDLDDLAPFSDEAGVVLDIDPPPYPGLAAYRGDRREYFFGRDKLSEDYARALEASGIFAIIGDSGSGKSSVAMAGVRPKFEAAHAGWLCPETFTPGAAPLRALADAITGCVGRADESLEGKLRDNPENAAALISAYCGGRSLLLVVDQLEELITLCRDGTREIFGKVICALATPDAPEHLWRCCVLLTLRTDYLSRLGQHASALHARIMSAEMKCNDNLPVLGVDGILQAIQKPAEKCRLRYLPSDIARELANQTAGMMSGLPLLQFALLRLWNNRKLDADGRPLDFINRAMVKQFLSDENDVLDVQGVLGRAAEEIFSKLEPRQQEICERLILELVLLDEDFEAPLRRRRNEADLVRVVRTLYEKDADAPLADALVVRERFEEAGLLTVIHSGEGADDGKAGGQLEVVHEALLRHWPRIRKEISAADTKTRLHVVREIAREAEEWAKNGEHKDYLKQGGEKLKRVLEYKGDAWLEDEGCNRYVEACEAAEAERVKIGKLADKAAKESQRRKSWRRLAIAGAVVAAATGLRSHSVKESSNANLGVVALLGERLPPREGLEVAYALASHSSKSILGGTPDYQYALGHALERMDRSQILPGDRDAELSFFANGQVLRQTLYSEGKASFRFFEVSRDGTVGKDFVPLKFDNPDQIDALELGPAVSEADPQRLLVVIQKSDGGRKVLAYWLDFTKKKAEDVFAGSLDWVSETWQVSPINIHPDGKRAVWAVAVAGEDGKGYGKLVQLDVSNGAGVLTLSKSGVLASAVAFFAGKASDKSAGHYIVGQWDGTVSCKAYEFDNQRFESGKAKAELIKADTPPVVRIGTLGGRSDFVVARQDKILAFSACDGRSLEADKPLASTELPGRSEIFRVAARDGGLRATLMDAKRQLRCFEDPAKKKEAGSCNMFPFVGADAAIAPDGKTLVVVEEGSTIRRYPARADPSPISMMARGATVIGWSPDPLKDSVDQWDRTENGFLEPQGRKAIAGAALSSDGTWLAWIDGKRVVRSKGVAGGGGGNPEEAFDHKDNFAPRLIAVSKDGLLAFSQGPAPDTGRPQLHIGKGGEGKGRAPDSWRRIDMELSHGQPTCLNFSSDGKSLVVGTEFGHVRIVDIAESGSSFSKIHPPMRKASDRITACDIAADGAVALGYESGSVWFIAPNGTRSDLTERVVYALPAPVRDVRLYDDEYQNKNRRRRIAALGGWQASNCVRTGFSGQSIRVWEFERAVPAKLPVSAACFPNQIIGGLGEWKADPGTETKVEPKAETLVLATPEGAIKHQCPACRPKADPDGKDTLTRLRQRAEEKGLDADQVRPDSADFKARYGINLDSGLISWIKSWSGGGRWWWSVSYSNLVRRAPVPGVPPERRRRLEQAMCEGRDGIALKQVCLRNTGV